MATPTPRHIYAVGRPRRVKSRPQRVDPWIGARALAGGALVRPSNGPLGTLGGMGGFAAAVPGVIVNPLNADADWLATQLDTHPYAKMSAADLLMRLVDVSPDVSRAYYDHILFMNPGWRWDVFPAGSQQGDSVAALGGPQHALIDAFWRTLKARHKTVDTVFDRIIGGGALRGGYMAELVLDKATATVPVDLATPDPAVMRWKRVEDVDLGSRWQMGQWDDKNVWLPMEDPTIAYVPIHPLPDQPWGRPLFGPVIFMALFTLAILHDVRRVVQQQGWPRVVIRLMLDKLAASIPEEDRDDPAKFLAWVEAARDQILTVWNNLQPDDAYITSDVAEVGAPIGAVDAKALGGIDDIVRFLERQIVRALKTMPLLLGINESTTETHANRQMDLHLAGVESLQHRIESLIETVLETLLRVNGLQGRVEFRFAQLRTSEVERYERAKRTRAETAAYYHDRGWVNNQQSAELGMDDPGEVLPDPRAVGKDPYPSAALLEAQDAAKAAAAQANAAKLAAAASNGAKPVPGEADGEGGTEEAPTKTPRWVRVGWSLDANGSIGGNGHARVAEPFAADGPPAPAPDAPTVDLGLLRDAVKAFDVDHPEFAGILRADVAGE